MKELLKQCASVLGAGFAAACCLGVASALAVLSAVGAGFLINDAILIPFYLFLLGLSAWLLYRSARVHGKLIPFWAGLGGLVTAFAGLWVSPALVYAGLAALIAGSVWDFWNGRAAGAFLTANLGLAVVLLLAVFLLSATATWRLVARKDE